MWTEHTKRPADDWTATDGMALNQSALTGLVASPKSHCKLRTVYCPFRLLNFHSRFPRINAGRRRVASTLQGRIINLDLLAAAG